MYVLGTAGHVDHGKSTLLNALTAMSPDRLPEEKKRGMTIDLNFVWFDSTNGKRIGIVDVPGHHRFVKNMITGVMNIDAFLFVVAADDGWMPQSEEHLQVLMSLGISNGIGIVTKTDLVSEERLEQVLADVQTKFSNAFGKALVVVPFSSEKPELMDSVKGEIDKLVKSLPPAFDRNLARVWVDRVFVPRGLGTVVTGTLREGSLRQGQQVEILPQNQQATIKSIQAYQQNKESVSPTSRVALQLSKIDANQVVRGDLLQTDSQPLSRQLDAKVHFFSKVGRKNLSLAFHLGTAKMPALVIPMWVAEDFALVRIKLKSLAPIRHGDLFLLRTSGEEKTVAGGCVLDPIATIRSHKKALVHLESCKVNCGSWVDYNMKIHGGVSKQRLYQLSKYAHEEIAAVLDAKKYIEVSSDWFLERENWETHKKRIAGALEQSPTGLGLEKLQTVLKVSKSTIEKILSALLKQGVVQRSEGNFSLKAQGKTLDSWEQGCLKRLEKAFRAVQDEPLNVKDWKREGPRFQPFIKQLVKDGQLVSLGGGNIVKRDTFDRIQTLVVNYIKQHGQAKTTDLKSMLQMSRKNVVMLLERLDGERVTYLKDGVRRLLRG